MRLISQAFIVFILTINYSSSLQGQLVISPWLWKIYRFSDIVLISDGFTNFSLVQIIFQLVFLYFQNIRTYYLQKKKKPIVLSLFFQYLKLIFFSCFITLFRTSRTMLNSRKDGRNPFLIRIVFEKQKYSIDKYENFKDYGFILLNCYLKTFVANLTLTSIIWDYLILRPHF